MLNDLDLLQQAKSLGSTKTLSDVDTKLATYDYPTLRTNEKANYKVVLWDKVTPINGIPAETILQSEGGVVPDQVYLIYINDKLVYMQKYDPEQIGFVTMDSTRATTAGNTIVDNLVEQAVDTNVRMEILKYMLS